MNGGFPSPLELWGGVECTIVRLGDRWRDQCVETGHRDRPDDIELIAELGIGPFAIPILWEAIAPERPDRLRLSPGPTIGSDVLRERGIKVVGGLLHHGSGPHYTDLLDPDFPAKLADFAARVAERYPWIETLDAGQRAADDGALLRPLRPLVSASAAIIRRSFARWSTSARDVCGDAGDPPIHPGAQLLQTEDLGKTFSTAPLRHQAAHENERRWLSLDLLVRAGRRRPSVARHPARRRGRLARDRGARGRRGGRPDLLGINHYLTSERFLDHRLHLYPGVAAGGNGRDTYVDAEAVRVKRLGDDTGSPRGSGRPGRATESRSRSPRSITAATATSSCAGSPRSGRPPRSCAQEGMDLRAVTLWSLFGNVDWRFLLLRASGHYDTGAFDVRGPSPRPTIVAKAAEAYARRARISTIPCSIRPAGGAGRRASTRGAAAASRSTADGRKLLITGATGTLGKAFARICEERALPFCLTARGELDICDPPSDRLRRIERHQPWAVINTAGFVRVADAEREREACIAANADGAAMLAAACADAGIPLVTFSSDLVFDGRLGRALCRERTWSPARLSTAGARPRRSGACSRPAAGR